VAHAEEIMGMFRSADKKDQFPLWEISVIPKAASTLEVAA